jgi:hypothetical protein
MTQLTWRDVATPDFQGVQYGLKAASETLDHGFDVARAGVKDVEKRQNDNQSAALLAELAKYDDAGQLQADLKSGAFQGKFDMSKLHPEDLKTVMSRPSEILAFAKDKTAFDQTQKGIQDSDYMRTNAPIFNGALVARRQGDKAFQEYYNTHKDILEGAPGAAFNAFLNNEQEISQGDLSRQGTQLNQLITGTNFKDGQTDRNEGRGFEQLKSQLSVFADQGARQRFMNNDANYKKVSEEFGEQVASRMRGLLNGDISGPAGGSGAGGGTGGTGAGGKNVYSVLLGDGQGSGGGNKFGFNFGDPTQKTMGEVYDFQRNVMIPATKAAGVGKDANGNVVGSSAIGAYQIVSGTLAAHAQKLFGDGWRNMKFDAAAQDKLGESIFNEAKQNGTDLHKVWEGLPVGTSAKGATWAAIRDKITMAESGGVVDPRAAQIMAETVIDTAVGGSQANDTIREIRASGALTDTTPNKAIAIQAVAGDLAGGVFKGADVNRLTEKIVEVKNRAFEKTGKKISAKAAVMILERAVDGEQGAITQGIDKVGNFFGLSDGMPDNFNDSYIDAAVGLLNNPEQSGKRAVNLDRAQQGRDAAGQAAAILAQIAAEEQAAVQHAAETGQKVDYEYFAKKRAAVTSQAGTKFQGAVDEAVRQNNAAFPDRREEAPPKPVAQRPAVPTGANLILANAASKTNPNVNADWVKRAKPVAPAPKKKTQAEFNAMLAAAAGKSLLNR